MIWSILAFLAGATLPTVLARARRGWLDRDDRRRSATRIHVAERLREIRRSGYDVIADAELVAARASSRAI